MPEHAYMYALPYEFYDKYRIRRYGFHGTSHDYVSAKGAELAGLDRSQIKIVTAHIGSGASMAAVLNGKCIDTSMGLTPSEGLIMGTRAGDIDSGVIDYILSKKDFDPDFIAPYLKNPTPGKTHFDPEDVTYLLTKKSGVAGISTQGPDMRDVDAAAKQGSHSRCMPTVSRSMSAPTLLLLVGLTSLSSPLGSERIVLPYAPMYALVLSSSVSSWMSSSIVRHSVGRARSSVPPIAVSRSWS